MSIKQRFVSPSKSEFHRLRQPFTPGERKVFELFDQHLDPEWEIYIQPHLNGLRPDFVLLNPNVGVAVFEVKDWNLDAMSYWLEERGAGAPVLFADKDGVTFSHQSENPVEKILKYKKEIYELYCPRLKQRAGFSAITAGVIFPFADDDRVKGLFQASLEYRGMDSALQYNPISGSGALAQGDLKSVFPESSRKFSRQMNQDLANDVRNWLIEPDTAATQRLPIELDKNQRTFATSRTDSGYRRIRGAAGSGKSLILAARAAELLGQGKQVLVVTFNITLLNYLMDVAVRWPVAKGRTRSDVTWLNFHHWCRRVCDERGAADEYAALWKDNDPQVVFTKLLPGLVKELLDSSNDAEQYDAVLVDEGQDFHPEWWGVLRKVCKPGGEMLLVADITQDIYGTADAWTDEAMKGAGFSGKWAELDVSYRMPLLALEKAAEFAEMYLPEAGRMLPRHNQIDLGLEQCSLRWVQTTREGAETVCCDEILRLFTEDGREGYSMADATFLCNSRAAGYEVVRKLGQKGIKSVHTYNDDEQECRRQKVGFYMGDARVKATTLHSFKGWESRSLVIYIGEKVSSKSLALLYTGLTRLKRHPEGSCLTIICSTDELAQYGSSWPEFENFAGFKPKAK